MLLKILEEYRRSVASGRPRLRLELLRRLMEIMCPGYRLNMSVNNWAQDPMFSSYLSVFPESHNINPDRRWALYQLMNLSIDVPGDTAEVGVMAGAMSYVMQLFNLQNCRHRKHHMFDSFEGSSAPGIYDGNHRAKGDLCVKLETVKENLNKFEESSVYHAGWIPNTFDETMNAKFSFVHIDVDAYQPTIDSMGFFYPRTNPGGIIVFNDWMGETTPGATLAIKQFMADKSEHVAGMPLSGGFMIRDLR